MFQRRLGVINAWRKKWARKVPSGHQKDIGPKRKKKEKMSEIRLTQQKPSVALICITRTS